MNSSIEASFCTLENRSNASGEWSTSKVKTERRGRERGKAGNKKKEEREKWRKNKVK
jgi:hypothetical protein